MNDTATIRSLIAGTPREVAFGDSDAVARILDGDDLALISEFHGRCADAIGALTEAGTDISDALCEYDPEQIAADLGQTTSSTSAR